MDGQVAITDSLYAPLATGVTAIRFDFPTTQNGFVGYREIDVIGTVPEPATATALLAGVAMLCGLRRRRA